MKNDERLFAEKVLKHLFIGATLERVQSGPSSKIYFTGELGELYLNIESKWCLYDSTPEKYPFNEVDMQNCDNHINETLGQEVAEIQLAQGTPHLIIMFKNGRILFVNGRHSQYECWQAGVHPHDNWLVTAIPGDEIAVWTPDD